MSSQENEIGSPIVNPVSTPEKKNAVAKWKAEMETLKKSRKYAFASCCYKYAPIYLVACLVLIPALAVVPLLIADKIDFSIETDFTTYIKSDVPASVSLDAVLAAIAEPSPFCDDETQNGMETDIDCGGGLCMECQLGQSCIISDDCDHSLTCVEGRCADVSSPPNRALQATTTPPRRVHSGKGIFNFYKRDSFFPIANLFYSGKSQVVLLGSSR